MERIGSAETRLVILHDSYHIITMDREKERVANECIHFLRGITAGS